MEITTTLPPGGGDHEDHGAVVLVCILRLILRVGGIYIRIPRLGVTSSWPSPIQIIPSFIYNRSLRHISSRQDPNYSPMVLMVTTPGGRVVVIFMIAFINTLWYCYYLAINILKIHQELFIFYITLLSYWSCLGLQSYLI